MPIVSVAGRGIRYELSGRAGAPVLMFANSLGTSLEMWDAQAAALSNAFAILRFDARGHGGSDPDGGPATIADFVDDAIAVLDAAGCERAHFIGLSLGGLVAQAAAVQAPDRILSIVVCATAAAFRPATMWDQRATAVLQTGIDPFVAPSGERWFTPAFRQAHPETVEGALGMLRRTDPASYAACCRVLRDTDLRPALPALNVPTLTIAGANDPSTPPAQLAEIAALVKGARSVVLPDAAHMLAIEQPEATTREIRAFVQSLA
ncbi:3-oxoadipate enol-lactonase [Enterovirga sp.]|jgi:3-oxoadipate enol-lactonase|uniref:3-oxoadipate enol-lactonase n=1 Tax=Enterovirga sp. TaxID=2026350 RepID=UPI00260F4800|nr:3-oxoadipate enol-lactonase [Enterovirga sp.]MDB5592040.1 3-oxoadipate enol-lactonase [Enterovirga sp.]